MFVSILPACMYVHHVCAWCLKRSEWVSDPPELVTDSYEPLYGCWDKNPDSQPYMPPQEVIWKEVLLNIQVFYR